MRFNPEMGRANISDKPIYFTGPRDNRGEAYPHRYELEPKTTLSRYQCKQPLFYFSRRFCEVDRFDTNWQCVYFEFGRHGFLDLGIQQQAFHRSGMMLSSAGVREICE
jgi:hypothetical protein